MDLGGLWHGLFYVRPLKARVKMQGRALTISEVGFKGLYLQSRPCSIGKAAARQYKGPNLLMGSALNGGPGLVTLRADKVLVDWMWSLRQRKGQGDYCVGPSGLVLEVAWS